MAEDTSNKKVISKKNSGIPDDLDFNQLRSDSISYLGDLTGKVWTDYNAHDPGITILEALIYAVMDLGYRTSLPKEDILAPLPSDDTPDDNFFTPAQIFACNPLTITDYRKLLVDIEGVKNAWIEVAQEISIDSICGTKQNTPPQLPGLDIPGVPAPAPEEEKPECCIDYLNGLYHVYLELEDISSTDPKALSNWQNCILQKVRKILMRHRNLCEDFVDIQVLCKFPIGVCADIELLPGADAEKTYVQAAEALRDQFSPAPKFYTLQQLLDRKIPIEDIFAGRPYDLGESHGFVDVSELEAIQLKKEIHLSDIYSTLLAVKGVKAVSALRLRKCNGTAPPTDITDWIIPIPENYIPDFSMNCSAFHFFRNGITVPVDTKKFIPYFNLNFSNNGKRLYPAASPYLDAAIEYGTYHNDLGDYLSIQNEFPTVYGIGDGQLAIDVTPERKAKALQLKGYLLFFDQLLANYLGQLQHIRTLFSFSNKTEDSKHSYFLNKLETVPELASLLRFDSGTDGAAYADAQGLALAIPVDLTSLRDKINSGPAGEVDILKGLPSLSFSTISECEIAMNLLRSDLSQADLNPIIVATTCNGFLFYFAFPTENLAIIGKRTYPNPDKALAAAGFVWSLAGMKENYKRHGDSRMDAFSFEIEFNFSGYLSNLQQIVETGKEYHQRRDIFLNHILSRFAESFTDYALLSYRKNATDLLDDSILAKERFLANYPDLSSNRGRAYDYSLNGWNNENVSGFERKFMALAGLDNWNQHSLCNFEVVAEDEEFMVTIPYGAGRMLTCNKVFDKETAIQSEQSLFKTLLRENSFTAAELPATGSFEVYIHDEAQNKYSDGPFATIQIAEQHRDWLNGLCRMTTSKNDVLESSYLYYIRLVRKGAEETAIRNFRESYAQKAAVIDLIAKPFKEINQHEKWEEYQPLNDEHEKTHLVAGKDWPAEYVDEAAFKIDINDTIEDKPGLFNYEILDRKLHRFKLKSFNEFATKKEAEQDAQQLLFLLNDPAHYRLATDEVSDKPYLQVFYHDRSIARSEIFKSEALAQKKLREICEIAAQHRYLLNYFSEPDKWRFHYRLCAPDQEYLFDSKAEFGTPDIALEQSRLFVQALPGLVYDEKKSQLMSADKTKRAEIPIAVFVKAHDREEKDPAASTLLIKEALEHKQALYSMITDADPAKLAERLHKTARSEKGDYVYRLVDKDNLFAVYTGDDLKVDCADAKMKRSIFQQLSIRPAWQLEISQGNDIIVEEEDPKTGVVWFHYQLRCLNRMDLAGKELILFESAKGYGDPDQALDAFRKEWLEIMQLALLRTNYDQYISLEKILIHETGACARTDTRVFIPRKTLDELGHYDEDALREIIALAHQFPLRSVILDSDEFKLLFECKEDIDREKEEQDYCGPVKTGTANCCNNQESVQTVYYFVIEIWSGAVIVPQWQSMRWYDSADEAWRQFRFFSWLRSNKVNYTASTVYADCDCDCRIYIREVLAQSATRFHDRAEAWGITGVERFICVTQQAHSFQTYLNRTNCCNSFYVACENAHAYHPCTYDTPERRDRALINLIHAADDWSKYTMPFIFLSEDDPTLIYDIHKNPLASFLDPFYGQRNMTFCEKLFYLWHLMIGKCNYGKEKDGKAFLKDDQDQVIAVAIDDLSLHEFREKMQASAYYFPLTETMNDQSVLTYCVDIKFPWHRVQHTVSLKGWCCEDLPEQPFDPCYIAWKSSCCYSSCRLAFLQYQEIFSLLKDMSNYHAVYDCTCNSYGIRLHTEDDIVAVSPQCYDQPRHACDAVERAKGLINCEGLHVVEHILLRPHCDKECVCLIHTGAPCNLTNCDSFRWSPGTSLDPCIAGEDICFSPGADPYSFIATVALPAWPARFRDKESRDLVEMMLYREAPAHVMLRVLWLAPHDLCCFETHYKKWTRYLAGKNTCEEPYTTCAFLDFLFRTNFECLPECTECACETIPVTTSCLDEIRVRDICNPFEFLNQVNQYFCWTEFNCCNYQYTECGEQILIPAPPIPGIPADPAVVPDPQVIPLLAIRTDPDHPAEVKPIPKSVELPPAPALIPAADSDWLESKERRNLINHRYARYRSAMDEIVELTKDHEHPVPLKAQSFLRKTDPKFSQMKELVEEAMHNKTPGAKKLGKKLVQAMIKNIISYYLDRISFDGNRAEDRKTLLGFLKQHAKKLDEEKLYENWDAEEAKKIQPGLDTRAIRKGLGLI